MFGISLGKLLILVIAVAAVWYGFKAFDRRRRVEEGGRRTGERSMGERLRKSMRGKEGRGADAGDIEDTEKCPTCGAFVSVAGIQNCGKKDCPY